MSLFEDWNVSTIVACFIGVICILFIMIIYLWVKQIENRKLIKKLFHGVNIQNVEELLVQIKYRVEGQEDVNKRNELEFQKIQQQLMTLKNVGLFRYNAFSDQGSDLSFSIAWLDQHQNGVVLTGLHGRDQSYLYAKPIEQGKSKYVLTDEEKEAINRSMKSIGSGDE